MVISAPQNDQLGWISKKAEHDKFMKLTCVLRDERRYLCWDKDEI
jgi:hypothetical protein